MKNKRRLLVGALPAALIALSLAAAPGAAAAGSACAVDGGTMTWGVKESFRSYISGTIAKGSWEASGGATYQTPSFTWSGATGEIDPETGAGKVTFPGTVHFTGHGGILDLTIATPTLVIDDKGAGTLLLDVRSNDTSGGLAVDEKQAEVGRLGAAVTNDAAAGALAVTQAPLSLTEAGAPAFGGFYQPGDELDPLSVDVRLDCPAEETTPSPSPSRTADATAAEPTDAGVPWLPIGVGAGVVIVLGAGATFLAVRRRAQG